MTDKDIIELFLLDTAGNGHDKSATDTNRFARRKLVTPYANKWDSKKYDKKLLDELVFYYVKSRFNDCESFQEALYRIKYGLEQRPVCKACGGPVEFDSLGYGFKDTCSIKCKNAYQVKVMRKNPVTEKKTIDMEIINDDFIINYFFGEGVHTRGKINSYISYESRGLGKHSHMDINIYNYVVGRFSGKFKFGEALYLIKEHLSEPPVCPHCKKEYVQFLGTMRGYGAYCSRKCYLEANAKMTPKEAWDRKMSRRIEKNILTYGGTITDDTVKDIFKDCNLHEMGGLSTAYLKYDKGLIPKSYVIYKDVYEYIMNRFNDSSSFREALYRILHDQEERPVCQICGKPVKFIGKPSSAWGIFCSDRCAQMNSSTNLLIGNKGHATGKGSWSEYKLAHAIADGTGLEVICGYFDERYYGPNNKGDIKEYECDIYIPAIDMFIEHQGYLTHFIKPYDGTNECLDEYNEDIINRHHFDELRNRENIWRWTYKDVARRCCAYTEGLLFMETWKQDLGKKRLKMIINAINRMKDIQDISKRKEIIRDISFHVSIYDEKAYLGDNELQANYNDGSWKQKCMKTVKYRFRVKILPNDEHNYHYEELFGQ